MIIQDALLSPSIFARPGVALDRVLAVVIHYPAAPAASALDVRDYWESLKTQDAADARPDRSASAHYVVGSDGIIIRALPEREKGYHVGASSYTPRAREFFGRYCTPESSPNRVTIGIEVCHFDWTGRPSPEAEDATVELVRDLCARYTLAPARAVWRHGDVTGKACPLWYMQHPDEWIRFLGRLR